MPRHVLPEATLSCLCNFLWAAPYRCDIMYWTQTSEHLEIDSSLDFMAADRLDTTHPVNDQTLMRSNANKRRASKNTRQLTNCNDRHYNVLQVSSRRLCTSSIFTCLIFSARSSLCINGSASSRPKGGAFSFFIVCMYSVWFVLLETTQRHSSTQPRLFPVCTPCVSCIVRCLYYYCARESCIYAYIILRSACAQRKQAISSWYTTHNDTHGLTN